MPYRVRLYTAQLLQKIFESKIGWYQELKLIIKAQIGAWSGRINDDVRKYYEIVANK